MNKTLYLIRHSSPFVEIENYDDYENVLWEEYNKNMILSVLGEEKASKLCGIEELKNIKNIYSSNSFRAISTAKYLSESNHTKIKLDDRINERIFGVKYLNELPKDFTERSFLDKNYKIKNGESLNDLNKRVSSVISNLIKDNLTKRLVVVTNRDVIQSAVANALNIPPRHQTKICVQSASATQVSYFKDFSMLMYSNYFISL